MQFKGLGVPNKYFAMQKKQMYIQRFPDERCRVQIKRYEDASLSYTGIDRHEGENRGGWDTVLSDADYNKMFTLQQASMEAPASAPDDLPTKPYFTPDEDEPKPTRRKAHRLPAAKSTSRATAIRPAQLPVPPAALHHTRWVRVLALELQSRALV